MGGERPTIRPSDGRTARAGVSEDRAAQLISVWIRLTIMSVRVEDLTLGFKVVYDS